MRASIIAGVALLLLAGLALFRGEAPKPPALTTPEGSNYYLLDARTSQYDAQGQLAYQITAQRVLHYPDDSAELAQIRVAYPGDKGATWRLRAEVGQIPSDTRDIRLSGSVALDYQAPDQQPLTLRTPQVWVRSEQKRAETDAPVVLTGPGREAQAVGMTVFFDRDLLKLHHDVRVTYQTLAL